MRSHWTLRSKKTNSSIIAKCRANYSLIIWLGSRLMASVAKTFSSSFLVRFFFFFFNLFCCCLLAFRSLANHQGDPKVLAVVKAKRWFQCVKSGLASCTATQTEQHTTHKATTCEHIVLFFLLCIWRYFFSLFLVLHFCIFLLLSFCLWDQCRWLVGWQRSVRIRNLSRQFC